MKKEVMVIVVLVLLLLVLAASVPLWQPSWQPPIMGPEEVREAVEAVRDGVMVVF